MFRSVTPWRRLAPIGLAAVALAGVGLGVTPAAASPTVPAGNLERPCVRTLPVGTSTVDVTFQGTTYGVRVHVPTAPARRDLPLVLDLHGSNNNGVLQADISDLSDVADEEGFIVANPTGVIAFPQTLPDGNWAWNVPGVPLTSGTFPPAGSRDDLAFLTTVVDTIDARGCVDNRRVYATGYSGGGRMASALACAESDVFAAVAPVAGLRSGRPDPADTTVPDEASCQPDRPVAVVTFHGTADVVNPYLGNGDLRWGYSVELAAETWAELNECKAGPTRTQISDNVTRVSWSKCARHADVVLYEIADGGHTWPDTDVDLTAFGLGAITREINASQAMWDFFQAHPRRGA
jgi:polyhydroxybutyrate depolymerase